MKKRMGAASLAWLLGSHFTPTVAEAETRYSAPIVVPSGVQFRQVVLGASSELYVGSASAVYPVSGASAPSLIVNTGLASTYIDTFCNVTGVISAAGPALLSSTINGAVSTSNTINNSGSTISGKQTQNSPVGSTTMGKLEAVYPDASAGNVSGGAFSTTTITPGE